MVYRRRSLNSGFPKVGLLNAMGIEARDSLLAGMPRYELKQRPKGVMKTQRIAKRGQEHMPFYPSGKVLPL